MSASFSSFSYRITPEVPPSYYARLFDFIYTQFLEPQKDLFVDITRESSSQGEKLAYSVIDLQEKPFLNVELKSGSQFELTITPLTLSATKDDAEEAKQDIIIALEAFCQNARETAVYFAWREGENVVPEAYTKPSKSFHRLFLETQIIFFLVFIVFGSFIFIAIGSAAPEEFWVAPLLLIGIQFLFIYFSNHFIARSADWSITKDNPSIQLLEFFLPVTEKAESNCKYPREALVAIKKEIYDKIISKKGRFDVESASQIFQKHGVPCEFTNLKAKKVDVYELVKSIADRFSFPVPKIMISNTMVPNAAASGTSPKNSLVLLTTGLLVRLNEDELRGVLGHEFGHLKGRDPLLLYGLVSAEFLFRFYVLFPLFPIVFSSILFFGYFWAVMILIFFVAKFFEARADLVSAMLVGNPKILAGSLTKIGFQRLLYERQFSFRLQEWLGLDPHPPIYFRIHRLERLTSERIAYPLLRSIKDVTRGFIASIRNR